MAQQKSKIHIDPAKEGSLTAIAKREGGYSEKNGISKQWARKKLISPNTSTAVKKKINFFLNFNR